MVLRFVTLGNRNRLACRLDPRSLRSALGEAVADEQSDRARLSRSQIAAVTAGNALEFYDFVTYAFFATQIGRALFPGNAENSLLLALATFGLGFLTRPLG